MKFNYFIKQKLKLASLITIVMVVILITNLVSSYNLHSIDKTTNSIYNDRLIPVTDLFYISHNIFEKTLLLENFISDDAPGNTSILEKGLFASNSKIDSLVSKYEKTYLVQQEEIGIKELKTKLNDIRKVEKAILIAIEKGSKEEAEFIYKTSGKEIINGSHIEVQKLTNLQSSVSTELIRGQKMDISSSDMLSTVQSAITLLIGVFILSLTASSKIINQRSENFNLN